LRRKRTCRLAFPRGPFQIQPSLIVVPACRIPAYDIGFPSPWKIQARAGTEEGRDMRAYHPRLANTAGIPAI